MPAADPDSSSFFRESRWKNRFEDEILAAASAPVSKVRIIRLENPAPDSYGLLGILAKEETGSADGRTGAFG